MTSQLPERPNLEQLKKQAKTLLHAAQEKNSDALARFQVLPAFAKRSVAEIGALALALHDAQSVIAREHGFPSWTALRENVEERTLSFAAAVEEFLRCATGGATARALRLLALHPGIARANLHTALVLGDAEFVATRLRENPALIAGRDGPESWEPLLYVCHTSLHHEAPERAAGLAETARLLLARGANPNGSYHWRWHPEVPRTALWSALCHMRHLELAKVLLEGGANPDDGVSLHMAAGADNLAALELLRTHGANPDGQPGGLPPLCYILGFAKNETGPRWLLEHDADPNLAWAETGEAPVHVAARRWPVTMMELLVQHGADVLRRRADGCTAHTLAELQGNHAVAQWLLAHGAKDELTELERFVAACVRGERGRAEAMLQARPALRTELRESHHLLLLHAADQTDPVPLTTMLSCGFDPRRADKDGVTPLHRAAMNGRAENVRLLLAHGAPVDVIDAQQSGTPLLWAAGGSIFAKGPQSDHVAVARLLLEAGSPTEWDRSDPHASREEVLDALAELRRAATSRSDDTTRA